MIFAAAPTRWHADQIGSGLATRVCCGRALPRCRAAADARAMIRGSNKCPAHPTYFGSEWGTSMMQKVPAAQPYPIPIILIIPYSKIRYNQHVDCTASGAVVAVRSSSQKVGLV